MARWILGGATKASKAVKTAVREAEKAQETVLRLSNSREEIGRTVRSIGAIANQTKLLALNASI